MSDLMRREKAHLFMLDMQVGLLPVIWEHERVQMRCIRLVRAARILGIGITLTEHYPRGLGKTAPAIRDLVADNEVFKKMHFSCAKEPRLLERLVSLRAAGVTQMIIAGIEAHICVLQSAVDFQALEFEVFVVADAAGSRSQDQNKRAWLRLSGQGIQVVDSDMAIFEWLGAADTPEFRAVLPIVRDVSRSPP